MWPEGTVAGWTSRGHGATLLQILPDVTHFADAYERKVDAIKSVHTAQKGIIHLVIHTTFPVARALYRDPENRRTPLSIGFHQDSALSGAYWPRVSPTVYPQIPPKFSKFTEIHRLSLMTVVNCLKVGISELNHTIRQKILWNPPEFQQNSGMWRVFYTAIMPPASQFVSKVYIFIGNLVQNKWEFYVKSFGREADSAIPS
ncbi:hypothetical protein C8R45DRAFT_947842 [Mycena sanguinolenta]|nr:hypothetical protein C8R45DRAFT_947842 [Mycena sanguinolenta]